MKNDIQVPLYKKIDKELEEKKKRKEKTPHLYGRHRTNLQLRQRTLATTIRTHYSNQTFKILTASFEGQLLGPCLWHERNADKEPSS